MNKEAMFYEKKNGNNIHCYLCAHNCLISEDKFGICGVRHNKNGKLFSIVYGELISESIDPIEKKPLYHMLPGSKSYSAATIGCNFKCGFCQNWQISQTAKKDLQTLRENYTAPESIVERAVNNGCKSIAYTYTEPTIFFEYAYDTAKLAKKRGLYNIFVTNGYMTEKVIEKIRPYLDAVNIDLKSFNDDFYKKACKARLEPVLNSIKKMKKSGIWVEITTLIIPEENDSNEELNEIARFIAGISKDIPWHLSAFYPTYKFADHKKTSCEILNKAYDIGKSNGLNFIYIGNIIADSNTYCPNCRTLLISRKYFNLYNGEYFKGKCTECGRFIEGFWE